MKNCCILFLLCVLGVKDFNLLVFNNNIYLVKHKSIMTQIVIKPSSNGSGTEVWLGSELVGVYSQYSGEFITVMRKLLADQKTEMLKQQHLD